MQIQNYFLWPAMTINSRIYVVDMPYLRDDKDDDIRICTHPDYQGKGIGKFMLNEIIKIYPTAYGKVKIENKASQNLFLSLGFKKKFIIFEYEC